MMIEYECHGSKGMRPREWNGEIKVLSMKEPYEVEINARGSRFHLIIESISTGIICVCQTGI